MREYTEQQLKHLLEILDTPSATGFEQRGQQLWVENIKPYVDGIKLDNYGTAYGIIYSKSNRGSYKVMIEAHCDEIAWYVHHITSEGLIYVKKNGGSDHQIAPSKRVNIYTNGGNIVKGVFGWPAIHTRTKDIEATIDNLFIDVGTDSSEGVKSLGIEVGNVVIFDDLSFIHNNDYICSRAIDNRAGGFMIANVARMISEKEIDLGYDLYIVNSVQEEIGLRGAEMIASTIKPDVAIVTDVTHHTSTPTLSAIKHGSIKCGDGPVLSVSPAVHNKLLKLIKSVALEFDIPYQMQVSPRYTGTDTDAIAYRNNGVVSALISLPLKYMHTTNEMVSIKDMILVEDLIFNSLLHIESYHDFKYFTL